MAITPTNSNTALGTTRVKAFGTKRQNEIIDNIILQLNDLLDGSISTTSLTLTGALIVGTTSTFTGRATFVVPNAYSSTTGITAFATGGQASATALTTEFNTVTVCATAGDSVKLPTPVTGLNITVKNIGAAALDIFPSTGVSINALAANLAVRLQPRSAAVFYATSATAWHTTIGSQSLTLNSTSTVKGQLELKATDSAGNTITTITNASQAAARTYTIPDAGASANFVLSEGTATINGAKTFGSAVTVPNGVVGTPGIKTTTTGHGLYEISATQLGVSVAGALTAVADTAGIKTGALGELVALAGITYTGQDIKSASAGLTALAGGAQAGTALTKTYNEFTTVATASDSAQLPIAVLGKKVIVKNSAAKALAVFGQTGDAIDGAAANASFIVQPGQEVIFEATAGTVWQTKDGTSLGTISSVTQITSITTGVTVNSKKGIITTFTPSTAALGATTFTVTCNKTTATSNIRAYVTEYGGTVLTNGLPYVFVKNQTATSFDIIIYNAHATNALATSLKIGFEIIN